MYSYSKPIVVTCRGHTGELLVEISHVGHGGGSRRNELRIVGLLQNLIEVEHTEKAGPKEKGTHTFTHTYTTTHTQPHTHTHTHSLSLSHTQMVRARL